LDFDIPLYLEDDDYSVLMTINSEDEFGIEYTLDIDYDIEIDREKHELTVTKLTLSSEEIKCKDAVTITLDLINTGEEDEDVKVYITSNKLFSEHTDSFELDDTAETRKSYHINLNDILPGDYPIDVNIEYEDEEIFKTLMLKKTECESMTEESPDQEDENDEVAIITTGATIAQPTTTASSKEKSIMPYVTLGAVLFGLIIAIILLTVLSSRR